jgi:hypothetical protein
MTVDWICDRESRALTGEALCDERDSLAGLVWARIQGANVHQSLAPLTIDSRVVALDNFVDV